MDGGAWQAAVHGVSKSRTRLSDFTFTFHFHALEKEMATHSSILAWRIPGTEEPNGLPSMGSHRVGHDWSDLAAVAAMTRHLTLFECLSILKTFSRLLLKTTLGNSNIQGSFSLSTSYMKIEFVNTDPWLRMSMNRLLLYFWNFHKISHLFVKRNTK